MAEDEEVVQPEEVQPEVTQDSDPVEGTDYEVIADGRYKWSDGSVTDVEGNALEEEDDTVVAPVVAPVVTPAPVAAIPQPTVTPVAAPQPQPVVPTAQRTIYTRDATRAAIYSQDKLQEIADIQLTDPLRAEMLRAEMTERYHTQVQALERHSNNLFEQDLDELAASAPRSVQGLTRQIQKFKERMSPEERQQPGAARWAYSQAAAEVVFRDPLAAEEAFIRATTGVQTPNAVQAVEAKPAPKRPVAPIPREDRVPGPGSARRTQVPRRPAGGGPDSDLQRYARLQKELHPSWTDEECVDAARTSRLTDEDAKMRRAGNV